MNDFMLKIFMQERQQQIAAEVHACRARSPRSRQREVDRELITRIVPLQRPRLCTAVRIPHSGGDL